MPLQQLAAQLAHFPITGKCAVAVSGGGDSLALCLMLKKLGYDVVALHFNHKLRNTADSEALWLQELLNNHGISCLIGRWQGNKPRANLQKQAREARYSFFTDQVNKLGLAGVFVAHTLDDQIETFWLRLAHGSGLKGLAHPLKPQSSYRELTVYRPLLTHRREDLRSWLRAQQVMWLEDPSNDNDEFYRVRVRKMLPELESWGLGEAAISRLMQSCAEIENGLQQQVKAVLANISKQSEQGLTLQKNLFTLPEPVQKRAIIHICRTFGGETYPPRTHKIERLLAGLSQGQTMPLANLVFRPQKSAILVEKCHR